MRMPDRKIATVLKPRHVPFTFVDMQRIGAGIKKHKVFLICSVVYAIAIAVLFPSLRYYVDNPDTVSYISIAHKYASGDFSNAVNGYWSPLITWMLGLLLIFLKDEITTFKIMQLWIGWFALFSMVSLIQSVIRSKTFQWILSLACIPFIMSFGLLNLTPDLLFLAVVLFYLVVVSEKEFFNYRHFGLIAGVLGLLMYFSKAFGFCFFLFHFTILIFRNLTQTREYAFKQHLRSNYLQAVVWFGCISSIWIYLLSAKYGYFTISENASYNLSWETAAGPGEENILPVLSGGLYKPINPTAINAWEDPGFAIKVFPLSPFSSAADFNKYVDVLKRNLLTIYYFDFHRQAGFIFFLIVIVFLFSSMRRKLYSDDYLFSLFLSVLLIYIGYSLILVHTRYIWTCSLLMLVLSAYMLQELSTRSKLQSSFAWGVLIIFLLLAVKRPLKELLFSEDKDISTALLVRSLLHPVQTITASFKPDRKLYEARMQIAGVTGSGTRIASIRSGNTIRDGYTQGSLLALESGSAYYGQVTDTTALRETLSQFGIDYVVSFTPESNLTDSLSWKEVYAEPTIPITVYSLKK